MTAARTILLAILVAAPAVAHGDAKTEAQLHVDKGTKLHDAMQFAEALDELMIAYSLDPRPELLFAVGQLHVKLNNCSQAIAFYTRFLSTKPDAGPADAAREAIATCAKDKPAKVDVKAEAERHIANATGFHQTGKFAAARAELVVAYALDPSPSLLYAIAQVHVKLDACEQAIPYYELYLSTNPDAAEATQAIQVCTFKRYNTATPKPVVPAKPAVVAPPSDTPAAWYTDKLGLGLAGGGVALALLGAFEYKAALNNLDDAEAATTYRRHAELVDSAHGKRAFAAVFATGGFALIGVGVWRFVTHDRQVETHHVAIVPTEHGGSIAWSGRW